MRHTRKPLTSTHTAEKAPDRVKRLSDTCMHLQLYIILAVLAVLTVLHVKCGNSHSYDPIARICRMIRGSVGKSHRYSTKKKVNLQFKSSRIISPTQERKRGDDRMTRLILIKQTND